MSKKRTVPSVEAMRIAASIAPAQGVDDVFNLAEAIETECRARYGLNIDQLQSLATMDRTAPNWPRHPGPDGARCGDEANCRECYPMTFPIGWHELQVTADIAPVTTEGKPTGKCAVCGHPAESPSGAKFWAHMRCWRVVVAAAMDPRAQNFGPLDSTSMGVSIYFPPGSVPLEPDEG